MLMSLELVLEYIFHNAYTSTERNTEATAIGSRILNASSDCP